MSTLITGRMLSNKKSELTHELSGVKLITAAPLDNQGDGSSFSPTDLVGASLASCILTIMGLVAERDGIKLSGATFSVEKQMQQDPRRIAALGLEIHLPADLAEPMRRKLERCADTCPVKRSLHRDTKVEIRYHYDIGK